MDTRIIIEVRGGCVQAVYGPEGQEFDVEVLDWDAAQEAVARRLHLDTHHLTEIW